ncbi:AAA domain protein [Shuttleworthella sp. MSX8B]|uniref:ATP-binding protein n=1 Tax=Shuttleworthella sp. MSX8B TaxID=936574 RepID=UPI00044820A7|nr:ATP-binding protein [Shuttleworthia sp. MSX8B]EUB16280.1 AAA domain protein [Shuttleworthia sp. MSX8B]
MIIQRDLYLNRLIERQHNGLIKIITGIRRCGKSYLLNELFVAYLKDQGVPADHIIQISMEGVGNRPYRDPVYTYKTIKKKVLDSSMYYVIIDEVQMMTDFTDVLNGLMQIRNADVYVTGSNSKFLSSDIATEFRGRGDMIQVHPLRFAEFVTAYEDRQEAWDDYFSYGGMPLVLSYKNATGKEEYLSELFASTYAKDIVERNHLRNAGNLQELVNVIASGIGSFTNPTKLEKTFLSVKKEVFPHNTIDHYINCLEDAFIVSKAHKYDVKGRKYIGTPYKIYFEDVGLRNAQLNFRQIEENHIMENILFNELRIRGFRADVGVVECFSKDTNGKTIRKDYEVDFVVNRGSERYYIQSAYEMASQGKIEQEKNSLTRIGDSFKKIIVVKGYMKPKIDEDGIVRIGLINFLLDDHIIE